MLGVPLLANITFLSRDCDSAVFIYKMHNQHELSTGNKMSYSQARLCFWRQKYASKQCLSLSCVICICVYMCMCWHTPTCVYLWKSEANCSCYSLSVIHFDFFFFWAKSSLRPKSYQLGWLTRKHPQYFSQCLPNTRMSSCVPLCLFYVQNLGMEWGSSFTTDWTISIILL